MAVNLRSWVIKEDLICAVNLVYHHLINYDFPNRSVSTLGA
ncbi:MAG: hypothetical protein WCF82_07405 [Microcoleus sp.]